MSEPLSQSRGVTGFYHVMPDEGAALQRRIFELYDDEQTEYHRLPGLYRLWDLPLVIGREDDYQVHYAELTEDGAPLFAVYRRSVPDAATCIEGVAP